MKFWRPAAAVTLAIVLLPLAARAAAPIVTRAGGITVIDQPDSASGLLHVELVLRAGLDRQTLAQNGLAALTARTILRTPVDGTPLEDAIAAHGGSIRADIDGGDVRFAIEALPSDAAAVLSLAQRAIARPAFDAATVGSARAALLKAIAANQQEALRVGLDMLSSAGTKSANGGLPALGIPALLAQFTSGDVRNFYAKFYRAGGGFLSAAGRTDLLAPQALATFAQAIPSGQSAAVSVALPRLTGTSRELIAHRDITAPWLVAQYAAPPIESRDFGPMLVLRAFMQRTLADIAEVPGVISPTFASRAVGSLYQYDETPPNLTLYVNGGIGNPNRSFATALSIATILASTKLQGSIDEFKATASGDFVSEATSLESRAWLAVVFARNGSSPDYLNRTLGAIDATSSADLQRVARKYLGNPTIALVLPRDKQQ
ncbi:MAG: insulinase family protein [Candidatus Eremiobacteraeota bacterium]|nr:insulinase family protein [Candidatus Eremiobacteraeota bacterium]